MTVTLSILSVTTLLVSHVIDRLSTKYSEKVKINWFCPNEGGQCPILWDG